MDEATFERFMSPLRDGTGYVELDVQAPIVGGDMAVVNRLDDERQQRIKRGERVAFLYTHARDAELAPTGHRQWVLQAGANPEQAQQLMRAGARWVGLPHLIAGTTTAYRVEVRINRGTKRAQYVVRDPDGNTLRGDAAMLADITSRQEPGITEREAVFRWGRLHGRNEACEHAQRQGVSPAAVEVEFIGPLEDR